MNFERKQGFAPLHLAPGLYEEMKADVAAKSPLEACGLVGGTDGQALKVFSVTNILQSPVRFRMDPQEQWQVFKEIEQRSWELLAIYHSHPFGPAGISATDIAQSYYPEVVHLIWFKEAGRWLCRGYVIQSGKAIEVQIESNTR